MSCEHACQTVTIIICACIYTVTSLSRLHSTGITLAIMPCTLHICSTEYTNT